MLATLESRGRGRWFFLAVICFFLTESVLGFLLQIAPDANMTRCLSYACVVLACLFCTAFLAPTAAYFLTQTALLFTVGADWFLVMTDPREQLPAMLLFSGAQIAYFLRLYFGDASRKRRRVHLVLRAAVSLGALLLTLLVLRERTDAVALVSVFYYAHLLLNIVFAFLSEGFSFFSAGLVLFSLCDTLVGLSCIDPYLPLPPDSFVSALLHPGFDLAWAFYVPSQALLAVSLWKHKKA